MFTCTAEADPAPAISWQFNGQPIFDGVKYGITNGSTSTLTIGDVLESDGGAYTCVSTNIHHTDTATAQLTVLSMFIQPHLLRHALLTTPLVLLPYINLPL